MADSGYPIGIISIHALHEESDDDGEPVTALTVEFQSTLSMRRATLAILRTAHVTKISIHALHEESDSPRTLKRYGSTYISIHALHEESDTNSQNTVAAIVNFNPRSP